MKRRHFPFKAAHDPKGHKKKKKTLHLLRSSWDTMTTKESVQLIGVTKLIADDHIRMDDFTPMTRSSNAHIAEDHETAIQYLQ